MWIAGGALVRSGFPIADLVAVPAIVFTCFEMLEGRTKFPRREIMPYLMVGLFAAIPLSHLAHSFLSAAVEGAQDFGKTFLLFSLIVLNVNTTARLRTVCRILCLGIVVISINCWLQWFTGAGLNGWTPLYSRHRVEGVLVYTARVRYFGIFADPNDTAQVLVSMLPLALIVSKSRNSAPRVALFVFLLGIVCVSVKFTNSRSGFLGFTAATLSLLRVRIGSYRFPLYTGLALLLVLLLVPSRFSKGVTDRSAYARTQYWADVNRVFKRNPLFGVGYGHITRYVENERSVHSSYVNCYGDLGLVGYTFWLGLVATAIVGAWQLSTVVPDTEDDAYLKCAGRALLSSLLGFAVPAFFLSRSYNTTLFTLLALAAAGIRMANERLVEGELLRWWREHLVWAAPGSACVSILFVWQLIRLANVLQ